MKNNVKQFLKSFLSLKPIRNKTVSNGTALWVSAAILFTQIADALSTKLGLQLGAVEKNGAMASLITNYGFTSFIVFKVLASLFLIWAFWKRPLASIVLITLYVLVVINNLLVILALTSPIATFH